MGEHGFLVLGFSGMWFGFDKESFGLVLRLEWDSLVSGLVGEILSSSVGLCEVLRL